MRSAENSSARARPATRGSAAARCGASAADQVASSNGAQSVSATPSSTCGAIPTGVATTGTSQASASSTASPSPSRSDGITTALAALTHSGTSSGGTSSRLSSVAPPAIARARSTRFSGRAGEAGKSR